MAKIRPKTGPAASPGIGDTGAAKKKKKVTGKPALSAPGGALDHAKTAADLKKAKTSRTGELLKSKPGAARAAAGKKKPEASKNLRVLIRLVVRRAARFASRALIRMEARIERVATIIQRHHELGYVVRLGNKDDVERDEEIKKAALRLQGLGAGTGGGTPALGRLMERASGLDGNSPASDWATKFNDAGELINEAGQELHDLNTQLAFELQTTAEKMTQAEEDQSAVLKKFEEHADSILNNV